MMRARHLENTSFLKKEMEALYMPNVVAMPSVLALNEHVLGSADQSYAQGCRALMRKKFVKAFQNFAICEK